MIASKALAALSPVTTGGLEAGARADCGIALPRRASSDDRCAWALPATNGALDGMEIRLVRMGVRKEEEKAGGEAEAEGLAAADPPPAAGGDALGDLYASPSSPSSANGSSTSLICRLCVRRVGANEVDDRARRRDDIATPIRPRADDGSGVGRGGEAAKS
jgi:hypothetical protein